MKKTKSSKRGVAPLKLKGKEFGLWKVLKKVKPRVYKNGYTKTRWLCKCSGCGIKRKILTASLRSEQTLGCANCRRSRKGERNAHMVTLRKRGWTLKKIADKYKISEPRVKFILDREMAA